MSDILISFGHKVREERLRRGWSQEELAAKAGVHRTYIGMIERAEKNVTLRSIKKIACAFNLHVGDLLEEL